MSQGAGVVVAIVDTGVDGRHPGLRDRVLPGIDLVRPGGNGQLDEDGHGTFVAGLIAAQGRTLGIAPRSLILPIRNSPGRFGITGHTADAVEWAIDHGVEVICIAGGGSASIDLESAINRALARNIIVVAAAGNLPTDVRVAFPAAYPGVIAAAGVDQRGNQAALSVEGPEIVLAAPAVDIMGIDIRTPGHTGYATGDGTSASTAIVAGAAALVRARYPDLSAAEVVHRLTATADDKGLPGRDNEYGYGVVNLVRALTADVPPLPTSAAPTRSAGARPPGGASEIPWLLVMSGLALTTALVILAVAHLRRRRA
jgi:type VII secretion-associated serine protease mycosin